MAAAVASARVYCHMEDSRWPAFTRAFDCAPDDNFGLLKKAFVMKFCGSTAEGLLEKNHEDDDNIDELILKGDGYFETIDDALQNFLNQYQLYDCRGIPIADSSYFLTLLLDSDASSGNKSPTFGSAFAGAIDFWLRKKSGDRKHIGKGKNSYYYAHGENFRAAAHQPAAAPMQIDPRQNTTGVQAYTKTQHNKRQSPFGTDIDRYESVVRYSFEDQNDTQVKVHIPLPEVGKLDPSQIVSHFGERQFELLINGYFGKDLRFACSKTHSYVDTDNVGGKDGCRHVIKANKITLVIKKKTKGDIWFDLYKKKAIGDNDDP